MDAASTFPHGAIADRTARRASTEIGGIDVIAGKPEENGVIDAIVANGENAATFMTNANGVGDMSTVTIDGNAWILTRLLATYWTYRGSSRRTVSQGSIKAVPY